MTRSILLVGLAALMALVAACVPAEPEISRRGGTFTEPEVSRSAATFTEADFECLREAIYHEAAGNSVDGGKAVASVIINRAGDPRFPDTVCDVVADGEAQGRCQFSYRCDGQPERFADKAKLANAETALSIVAENPADDVTDGALFFHATWMPPGWFASLQPTVTLGGNIFYAKPM